MSATNGTRQLTRQQERAARRAREAAWRQVKTALHAAIEKIATEKRAELEFALASGCVLEADVAVHVPDTPAPKPLIVPPDGA